MPSEYELPPDPTDTQTRARLRDHAAGLIRDLIRARMQQDPDWPTPEVRERWRLSDAPDPAPVVTLLKRVRQRVKQFEETYLNTTGSFPYFSEEDGSSPEQQFYELLATMTEFVDLGRIDEALKCLRDSTPIDWKSLADWSQLPRLRELLDALPESTADSGRILMMDGRFFFNRKIIEDLTAHQQIFLSCVVTAENQTISIQSLGQVVWGTEDPPKSTYSSTQNDINELLKKQNIPWRLSVPRGSEKMALVPRNESKKMRAVRPKRVAESGKTSKKMKKAARSPSAERSSKNRRNPEGRPSQSGAPDS